MIEKLKQNKFQILFLAIIFLFIYIICSSNMMAQDEYNYSNISNSNGQRVESISDIIKSQCYLYRNWTGRVFATGITQFFLMIGDSFYHIINPLIFILFIILIGKIFGEKNTFLGVSYTVFLIVCTTKAFWEKYIWMSGSFNYLWPATAMLVVMYYFYNMIILDKEFNKKDMIILPIISFLTGWSQENIAFVTGMFIIIIVAMNFKKIINFSKSKKILIISSILIFGIGAMGLIFAPGNFARMNSSGGISGFKNIIINFWSIKYLILLFIISAVYIFFKIKNKRDILLRELIYFITPMLVAILPMIIIPEFPSRSMLAYELCIIIVSVRNLIIIEESLKNKRKLCTCCIIIITLFGIYTLLEKASFASQYIKPYKAQLQLAIEEAKSSGEKNVIVPKFEYLERAKKLDVLTDMFPKESDISIINTYISIYYNIDTIVALPRGTTMLEINVDDEEEIKIYNLLSRENDEIVTTRIVNTELQMPNMDYKNKIVFIIPNEYLGKVYLDLPDDVKSKVKSVFIKSLNKTKEISIYEIMK